MTEQEQEKEQPKIYESFLFKVFAVATTVLVLYFIISPYQNCIRSDNYPGFCTKNTGW